MVWSPLAQGVLTGKYKKGAQPPKGSRATTNSNPFIHQHLTDEKLVKVEQLSKLADELGITTAQLALAWILREPNISSTLVGASSSEQIEENAQASDIKLNQDTLNQIEAILNGEVVTNV